MNPLVEEAMRLADEVVAGAAREAFMPGGFREAQQKLRAFLEQHLVVREPLTEEEIKTIAGPLCSEGMRFVISALVRAIEAAHGVTKKDVP